MLNLNKNPTFKSKKKAKADSVKNRMQNNLLSSKFRILNEKLYTTSSKEAFDYFSSNPEDYEIVYSYI